MDGMDGMELCAMGVWFWMDFFVVHVSFALHCLIGICVAFLVLDCSME